MKNYARILAATLAATMLAGNLAYAAPTDQGWVLDGQTWYYKDASGNNVTETWKPSGENGAKYYLGEDGRMKVSEIFEHNDKIYAVDEGGAQLVNKWSWDKGPDVDEEHWYFFGSNGAAYEKGWKTINDRRYHFTDSIMDYGFLDSDGEMLDDDDDTAWKEASYYCHDESEGWMASEEWVELSSWGDDDEYSDYESVWLYFEKSGKKAKNKIKTINGARYQFDENGAMVQEWYGTITATSSNATLRYYNNPNGNQMRSGWFKAVPSEEMDAELYDNGEEKWFYANGSGSLYKNGVKTVGSKKYLFDEYGIMRTGFVVLDEDKHIVALLGEESNEYPTVKELVDASKLGDIYFFQETGNAKTGSFTVELDGEKYTMKFRSSGVAIDGVESNKLYHAGILCKADKYGDYKYEVYTKDGVDYLIDRSGNIKKEGEHKDNNDVVWTVKKATEGDGYIVTKGAKK